MMSIGSFSLVLFAGTWPASNGKIATETLYFTTVVPKQSCSTSSPIFVQYLTKGYPGIHLSLTFEQRSTFITTDREKCVVQHELYNVRKGK